MASPACTEVKRIALLLSQHARLLWLPLVPHCQPRKSQLEQWAGMCEFQSLMLSHVAV